MYIDIIAAKNITAFTLQDESLVLGFIKLLYSYSATGRDGDNKEII